MPVAPGRFIVGAMPEGRPGPLILVARTAARVRSRGAGEVLGLAGARLQELVSSEDALIVYARPTGGDPPARPGSDAFGFREAAPSDGDRYARDIGTDSAWSFRARLSATTRCFVVTQDELIVHASWMTTGAAWTRELRRYFRPPAGDAYVYESFTRPEVRGRGVYPLALTSIAAWLSGQGATRVWVAVEAGNPASVKAVVRAGFEPGFKLRYRRRFGRLSLSPPAGPLADDCSGCLGRSPSPSW
jgi:RimJ/RimL family protein N-acetyltransferase